MQADPATMAAAINSELLKDNSEAMGVTMLLGILNLSNWRGADGIRAGHEDPLLLSADGKTRPIRLEGGPPLCVVEYPYPLETLNAVAR